MGAMTTTPEEVQYLDGGGVTAGEETTYDGGSPIEAAVDLERDLGYPQLDRDAPETQEDVTPFTLAMYSFLPVYIKEADQTANPEGGGWPLLRFLDAAGHIPDQIRAKAADIASGRWTNPATVPEDSLRWLASLFGVPSSQKSVPAHQLRQALIDLVDNGRPADGTRGQIAAAAKQFLVGTRTVSIRPGPDPHTIAVVAKPDEVRQGDLAALADQIRSVGVVPAGHSLVIATVTASWDDWEAVVAAEGGTWDDAESLAVVWTEEEAIGATVDDPTTPTP